MKMGMGDEEMIIYQILNGEALHCDAAAQTGIPSFQIQITFCSLKSDSKHEDTFPENAWFYHLTLDMNEKLSSNRERSDFYHLNQRGSEMNKNDGLPLKLSVLLVKVAK